ncbi:MAG: hypothetical protein ACJA0E_000398 [Bermanella sp.]|jgi:hypothetical protein
MTRPLSYDFQKTIYFIILSLSASSALAITNIESQRLSNSTEGTSGSVSLALDGRIGESDKFALGTSIKLIKRNQRSEIITIISRDYAEVDDVVNTDESFIHLRYLHKYSNNWGQEVFSQYQEDKFSFLKKRSLIGAGARYTLTQAENRQSANHFGIGLFYENEVYISSINVADEHAVRFNIYWAYKNNLANTIQYTSTLYLQSKTNRLADQKGIWQNAVTISVTSTINLSLSWDIEHDTETPTNRNNTETSYDSVLIYNF